MNTSVHLNEFDDNLITDRWFKELCSIAKPSGYGEYEIIESPFLRPTQERKQYRFPKSKKVRIRKKWSKQPRNLRYETTDKMIVIRNKIFLSTCSFNNFLSKYGKAKTQN
jgi:hypothetical protein